MRICKRDKWKTVYCIRYEYFEYQIILFGLFNVLASFQEYIHKILIEKLDVFIIIYLDNILISTDKIDYIDIVWEILDQLKKHYLYTNLKKCHFHQEQIWFLGYVVSSLQSNCMEDKRIKAIYDWFKPLSLEDIQVFLSFANFYWQFI